MLDAVGGGCNNPLSNSGAPLCTASEGEAVLLDVLDIFVGESCVLPSYRTGVLLIKLFVWVGCWRGCASPIHSLRA